MLLGYMHTYIYVNKHTYTRGLYMLPGYIHTYIHTYIHIHANIRIHAVVAYVLAPYMNTYIQISG
jgi:hypothetical protein